jgi:glycosyltransferase involved in cell wall biosynthesis
MRVLHVVASQQRRGGEIFASDLVRALNDRNVTQQLAVIRDVGPSALSFDAPTAVLGANGRRVLSIHPGSRRALHQLIRDWRPDVLQAHGGEALKYAVSALANRSPEIVYRRIGRAHPWITSAPQKAVWGWLMRRAARVVAVAEVLRVETIDLFGVSPGRVVTIPNGVDVRRLGRVKGGDKERTALGIPRAAPLLLSVGAFTVEKDPFAQIDLAERILRERAEVIFVMVGDGPMWRAARAEVLRRGLSGRVLLPGVLEDLGDLLSASDMLVLASRSEGMPASLIEAGMTGLPVVAYAVGGVSEVVLDGLTGLLAPLGDVGGLAQRALNLLGDHQARVRLGRAAQKRCLAQFEIRSLADRYLKVYDEVTGTSSPLESAIPSSMAQSS